MEKWRATVATLEEAVLEGTAKRRRGRAREDSLTVCLVASRWKYDGEERRGA